MNGPKLIVMLMVVLSLGSVWANTWPETASLAMGMPRTTDGHLEIRVWVGGGAAHPFTMYRIQATATWVRGEVFAWDEFMSSTDPETRKLMEESRKSRLKLLRREYCINELQLKSDVAWCNMQTPTTADWSTVLERIGPDALWGLPPQESLGKASCTVMDGVGVSIELVRGPRYHHVLYWNPDQCCPWPECNVAQRVLDAVQSIFKRPA